jgi:ComF family protein
MTPLNRLIDLILPPRCIVSGEIVDTQGMLSPDSWSELNFITNPQCNRCGFPFDFDSGDVSEENICLGCLKSPPLFDKARSALAYDDASRDVILSFKHGDQTQAVPSFIPWLNQAGRSILERADYLVPVPLHRWRILRRRFNQSALIAQYLSKDINVPALLDALKRQRATVTQGKLQANERQKNVKNAFAVNLKHRDKLKGKTIILIDDVYTTGATVNECTKVLLKAGAASVNILTLARVVKPQRG